MAEVTPTGTDIQISTDSAFSTIVLNDSGPYKTTRQFVKGNLPYGVDLYAKARHDHPQTGKTPWSATLCFKLIIPANIAGVCLDTSTTPGVFYWIDSLGNKVTSFDWTKHPIYMAISMATLDDARAPVTMTKIPLFYIKTAASGPVGTFADGKKCWWISDLPEYNFRPATCFKRSTQLDSKGKYVISPCCYMSTFVGHSETIGGVTCLGSKRSQTPLVSQTKATLKTFITNRNNTGAGISGFRMFDIWDLSALRILLLVAKASTNSQTQWGDNSAGIASPKTGSTNARAIFKGTQTDPQISIEDLWRCYWYFVDALTVSATGVVGLLSPMDNTTNVSFGEAVLSRYTQTLSQGWLHEVLDCPMVIGDHTHDLMELFLPKSVVATEAQSTFGDAIFCNGGDALAGGAFGYDETYQNYEQTGTKTVTFYDAYGNTCPNIEWNHELFGIACTVAQPGGALPICRPLGGSGSCLISYSTTPTYTYVTRTRTKTFANEPGIFSEMLGTPAPASNAAMVAARMAKN